MDNLGPHSQRSSDQRPHQTGKAKGSKNGLPVEEEVEWMFDTGAAVSAITKSTASKFHLTSIGATALSTTGGAIIMKTGLTMVFSILDTENISGEVECSLAVGVKPNNMGSQIVGMDQLAHVCAKIQWDPQARKGRLHQ